MKYTGRFLIIVFALTLALTGMAAAQDNTKTEPVNIKILPPAVLQAFKASYPDAVIKGVDKETENGVTLYEVESVDGKINRDLLYTADGKAVEIEESIAPENLPAPVKQTLDKEYPGAKILKAEILTKNGIKAYELSLQIKGKTSSVTIDSEGKTVK
ncbi:MAG: PepSY-like domain-containing protein [Candidatus Aminicenantes bacterium]|nr:PepSY-like domain-containing protein [Candidatus Aminicenantes bacterium]